MRIIVSSKRTVFPLPVGAVAELGHYIIETQLQTTYNLQMREIHRDVKTSRRFHTRFSSECIACSACISMTFVSQMRITRYRVKTDRLDSIEDPEFEHSTEHIG